MPNLAWTPLSPVYPPTTPSQTQVGQSQNPAQTTGQDVYSTLTMMKMPQVYAALRDDSEPLPPLP